MFENVIGWPIPAAGLRHALIDILITAARVSSFVFRFFVGHRQISAPFVSVSVSWRHVEWRGDALFATPH